MRIAKQITNFYASIGSETDDALKMTAGFLKMPTFSGDSGRC
jgi:hypothetical protein